MQSDLEFSRIRQYHDELEKDPDSPIFAALADAYRENGLLDEAMSVCQKGLKIHTNYVAAHIVMGQIYLDKGFSAEMEREFNLVLQLDPNNAVALSALGTLYLTTGRISEAVKYLEHGLFVNPDDEKNKRLLDDALSQIHTGEYTMDRQPDLNQEQEGHYGSEAHYGDFGNSNVAKGHILDSLCTLQGIAGAVLIGMEGAIIASGNSYSPISDFLAGTIAQIFFGSRQRWIDARINIPAEAIIEGESGNILLKSIEGVGILVVLIHPDCKPVLLKSHIDDCVALLGGK